MGGADYIYMHRELYHAHYKSGGPAPEKRYVRVSQRIIIVYVYIGDLHCMMI